MGLNAVNQKRNNTALASSVEKSLKRRKLHKNTAQEHALIKTDRCSEKLHEKNIIDFPEGIGLDPSQFQCGFYKKQ